MVQSKSESLEYADEMHVWIVHEQKTPIVYHAIVSLQPEPSKSEIQQNELVCRMIQTVNFKYLETQLQYSNYRVFEPYEAGDPEMEGNAVQPYLLFKVGLKIFKLPHCPNSIEQYR